MIERLGASIVRKRNRNRRRGATKATVGEERNPPSCKKRCEYVRSATKVLLKIKQTLMKKMLRCFLVF